MEFRGQAEFGGKCFVVDTHQLIPDKGNVILTLEDIWYELNFGDLLRVGVQIADELVHAKV